MFVSVLEAFLLITAASTALVSGALSLKIDSDGDDGVIGINRGCRNEVHGVDNVSHDGSRLRRQDAFQAVVEWD